MTSSASDRGLLGANDLAEWLRQWQAKNETGAVDRTRHKHWTPDRGTGYYEVERARKKVPSLVSTGSKAGKSRVEYTNRTTLFIHEWSRDFFISALNTRIWQVLITIILIYLFTFFFFSAFWYLLAQVDPTCTYNAPNFVSAYIVSMVTQQTIGYGNMGPNDCWWAALLITVQSMVGLLMDSVIIGIIFARISHPKYRGRTIAISDSAVISRRDGVLKFMFRVADFRRSQVVEPKVKAYLYTWGEGRRTAEGEHIPARVECLDIGYIDGMLLLPLIIEHTIDERSPLIGHTFDTLMAVNAEIIVTFEGTTEFGNPFMARQSYLPTEIHWGHKFVSIIGVPPPGQTHYKVDISRLHDVEPLEGLEMLPPAQLSRLVAAKALRTVPYPLLGENTLVISDSIVLAPDDKGQLALIVRVGDTYPNQHLEVVVRMYLYRWRPSRKPGTSGFPSDYDQQMLEIGYEDGRERLLLWLPVICKHVITDDSPLASWRKPSGVMADADSCIVVVVEGYMYSGSQNRMRMRIFNVLDDVKREHGFAPIVTRPADSPDFKPRVNWSRFHETMALSDMANDPFALSPGALRNQKLSLTHSDGVNGPADITEMTMRRMIEAAELKNQRTVAPEAHMMHLTPDTDPASTFRLRSLTQRRRLDDVQFSSLSPESSLQNPGSSATARSPARGRLGSGLSRIISGVPSGGSNDNV
ncbi:hypothetical protein WJX75_006642 [Coccomyxa subellipsoidea]|uniref:E set domain-containing protein n=1 Tax=Coccomyxa subellipsoidea TaxID=248742 RepID=A0ABR2YYB6_9CHLO